MPGHGRLPGVFFLSCWESLSNDELIWYPSDDDDDDDDDDDEEEDDDDVHD